MSKKIASKTKISTLQCILTVVAVSMYLASNVITGRQVQLPFGLHTGGGLLIFPITYILSDVFSEVYGYKWSRLTNWLSFFIQIVAVAVFSLTIRLPYPDYYTKADAFSTVLGSTPLILIGSLTAFVLGDFVNDKVFEKMKKKHSKSTKGFSLRAILSSFAGEIVDSLVFYPIAFGLTGTPLSAIAVMIGTCVCTKTLYEIIMLPITTAIVKKVSKYENKALLDGEEES